MRSIRHNSAKAPEYGALQTLRDILCAALLLVLSFTKANAAENRVVSSPSPEVPVAFQKATPTSLADLKSMEKHVEALVKKVSPAVVALEINSASGSGVVISPDGFVLTAGHVAEHAHLEVRITFPDGKVARGKTLGVAADNDAGLLKITDAGPWPHAELDDVKETRVGDWVLALGHPGGFDAKRSLVTRLGRIILLEEDGLQTDCTISPGDSGGPVFGMNGKVIGIHSFIRVAMSENYHVPVNSFSEDLKKLMKTDKKPATAK